MNFAVIRTSLLDKIRREFFSYDDIIIFIQDLVTTLGIKDYLKEVRFLPSSMDEDLIIYSVQSNLKKRDENYKFDEYVIKNNSSILSTYSFFDRVIKIDYDNIISDAYEYFDNEDDELILFTNMCIIECLVHEIVHAYQNFAIHETNYSLYRLMALELSRFEIMEDEEYDRFYHTFTFEREAIITAYETLIIISKKFLHNEALVAYYKECLSTVLLGGYKITKSRKIISPLELKYQYLFKKKVPEVATLDVYETLKFGFPIEYKEYDNFKNNGDELILRKTACNSR